jgi:hypothetical protein
MLLVNEAANQNHWLGIHPSVPVRTAMQLERVSRCTAKVEHGWMRSAAARATTPATTCDSTSD